MEILPKPSKAPQMTASVLSEARGHVAALIGHQPPGARLKAAFPRVARIVGMTERRVRAIWHGEARLLSAREMDDLRRAAARTATQKAAHDSLTHADRLDAAAQALEAIDPDLYGPEMRRLRNAAGDIRRSLTGYR